MSQEQNFDRVAWWNEQSFPAKELYRLDEAGALVLCENNTVRERTIATVDAENADTVIKNLTEKFEEVLSRVNQLEIEWVGAEDKLALADKVTQLGEYLREVNALGDFVTIGLLVHDWQHTIYTLTEEHYANKVKLAELAESLAESTNFKETALAFKEIADKWKLAGQIDKNRNDKLWRRVETARKAFMDRKKLHNDEEGKDLLVNLDLKLDLVEQAEAMAASTEWKKSAEAFHRLTEEWKTIGHTLNKKNEELWHRFLAAKSAFFERKRVHTGEVQAEQENNYTIKMALAEKAEALKDSTSWNVTAQAFAALMEEWKKTGRVPKEKGDELWNRFTAAQEHFFAAKKVHTDEVRAMHEHNYNIKAGILARAEELKNSTYWGDATAEMTELLEEWKRTGPISRAHGDKMWEDFNAARKHFFARKDANREQKKQHAETQKVVRAEQAKGMVLKLLDDIKEEEEKLVDFRTAIENITPGKKAQELKAHLESLIAEGERTIKRLKEKYAAANAQLLPDTEEGEGGTGHGG